LRHLYEFAKRSRVGGRDVGERFAVERDFGGFESFNESAVSDARRACRGIDPNLPQVTEGALFAAAVAIRVLASVINRVGSVAVEFGTPHAKAFGG
jgi:hypothetical protein